MQDYYAIGEPYFELHGLVRRSRCHKRLTHELFLVTSVEKRNFEPEQVQKIRMSIALFKLLRHPALIDIKDVFESASKFFVVIPQLPGGYLFKSLRQRGQFDEAAVRLVIFPIINALIRFQPSPDLDASAKPEAGYAGFEASLDDPHTHGLYKICHHCAFTVDVRYCVECGALLQRRGVELGCELCGLLLRYKFCARCGRPYLTDRRLNILPPRRVDPASELLLRLQRPKKGVRGFVYGDLQEWRCWPRAIPTTMSSFCLERRNSCKEAIFSRLWPVYWKGFTESGLIRHWQR
jgi:hypothetical protein